MSKEATICFSIIFVSVLYSFFLSRAWRSGRVWSGSLYRRDQEPVSFYIVFATHVFVAMVALGTSLWALYIRGD